MLDELTSSYTGYLKWLACVDKDDPTKEEAAVIRENAAVIRAKCMDS